VGVFVKKIMIFFSAGERTRDLLVYVYFLYTLASSVSSRFWSHWRGATFTSPLKTPFSGTSKKVLNYNFYGDFIHPSFFYDDLQLKKS
jgi:hypothetical protein